MARRTILGAVVLLLTGCESPAPWTGFVYPDADALTVSAEIGRFETFEQCRAGAVKTLAAFGRLGVGAYECGRACRYDTGSGLAVCAETRD